LAALTIASTAGAGLCVGHHDFDFDLRQKIHGVFAAAINFRVPFLAAKALDFGNGHALDSQGVKADFTSSSLKGLMTASIFFIMFLVRFILPDISSPGRFCKQEFCRPSNDRPAPVHRQTGRIAHRR
jgi:hypothetical protein